jgi:heme exporter protein A
MFQLAVAPLTSKTATMLEAQHLECTRGERTLFSGLNLSLGSGRLLQVGGANGSGKTSLLRILCGLLTPSQGEVRWNGAPAARHRDEFNRDMAYLGHLNGLKDELTPAENLETAAGLSGRASDRKSRLDALEALGVARQADLPVRHLSQGQRRRVALARIALAKAAPLWILDEPFNALDAQAVAQVEKMLAEHVAQGGMVVMATHLRTKIAPAEVLDLDAQAGRAC